MQKKAQKAWSQKHKIHTIRWQNYWISLLEILLSWKTLKKPYIPAKPGCFEIPSEGNLISSRNCGTSYSENEGHHKEHKLYRTKVMLILLASYLIHILHLCVLIQLGWGLICFLLLFILLIRLHLHLDLLTFPKLLITLLDQDSSSQLFWSGGRREIPYNTENKSFRFSIPFCCSMHKQKYQFLEWKAFSLHSSGIRISWEPRYIEGNGWSLYRPTSAWHMKMKVLTGESTTRKWDKFRCPGGSGKVDTDAVLDFVQQEHYWLQKKTQPCTVTRRFSPSSLKDMQL